MTPEDLAKLAVGKSGWLYTDVLRSHVAIAIRAAVAAERERCAQIAERFIPSGFTSDGKAGNSYAVARDDRARTIAAAIRAEP